MKKHAETIAIFDRSQQIARHTRSFVKKQYVFELQHFTDIKNMLDSAEVRTDGDSGTVAYLWENTKWYDDFPEVRFIENVMQELDNADFLLIRVGEDSDDTELRGSFWNNPLDMRLTRSIVFG